MLLEYLFRSLSLIPVRKWVPGALVSVYISSCALEDSMQTCGLEKATEHLFHSLSHLPMHEWCLPFMPIVPTSQRSGGIQFWRDIQGILCSLEAS